MFPYNFSSDDNFAKFEKFLTHSIIIPSFMTVGSQMPELDLGGFLPFVSNLPKLLTKYGHVT